jgi:hypothetical protein
MALLAACVRAVRRGGLGRNRGRGRLRVRLHRDGGDATDEHFKTFTALVGGNDKGGH